MPAQIDSISPTAMPSELTGLAAPETNASTATGSAAKQLDVVRKHEERAVNGTEQYGRSIKDLMARSAPHALTAHVRQVDGAGRATEADLSKVRATHIEVKFRTAIPDIPNAKHAYLEITRGNGAKQDLAAYPKGGDLGNDGGQLQFIAGNEKAFAKSSAAPYELAVPAGMTRTEYANSLVDGAKHYNAHAVRYDFVGQQETHFNSNSFVSSLIVARGGQTGLSDVCKIANRMDSGPVNAQGQKPALDDRAMSERVRNDEHANKAIAPGFANAGIEPARFGSSPLAAATPPPPLSNVATAAQSGIPVIEEIGQRLFDSLRGKAAPSPALHRSP